MAQCSECQSTPCACDFGIVWTFRDEVAVEAARGALELSGPSATVHWLDSGEAASVSPKEVSRHARASVLLFDAEGVLQGSCTVTVKVEGMRRVRR